MLRLSSILRNLASLVLLLGCALNAAPASAASTPRSPSSLTHHPLTSLFALDTSATTPSAPLNVGLSLQDQVVVVTWSAPGSDGGSPLTGYTATAFDPQQLPAGSCSTDASSTTCTITGLSVGQSYNVSVHATNALGPGPESDVVGPVTVVALPSAPQDVVATALNQSAQVAWVAPASNGATPISLYTVSAYDPTGSLVGGCTLSYASPLACTVTGLTNGVAYTFSVTATNEVGTSPASTISAPVIPSAAPSAPQDPSAQSGNAEVTVSWQAPLTDNGSAITGYQVETTTTSQGCSTDASTLSCTVTGLTNGRSYSFQVRATNALGPSPWVQVPTTITPFTVPDAPSSLTLTPQPSGVLATWTSPVFDGGSPVTDYTVTVFDASSQAANTCTTATDSCVVQNLANGQAYSAAVVATNAAGSSTATLSASSVTPATTPQAPTNVGVRFTNSSGDIIVTWTAPSTNGGAQVRSYTVTSNPGGLTCTALDTTSCLISDSAVGVPYRFSVVATNSVGDSSPSSPSAPITYVTVPSPPHDVTAQAAPASALVSWAPPLSSGGVQVTIYKVTASPGGQYCLSSTLSCVVAGLTNGQSYTFTVTGANAVGVSKSSAPSSPVVPATVPSAPSGLTSKVSATAVTLSWKAPHDSGGAPLTHYTLTASSASGASLGQCVTLSTSCVVTGLNFTTTYNFTLSATNHVGTSPSVTLQLVNMPLAAFAPNSSSLQATARSQIQLLVKQVVTRHYSHIVVTSFRDPSVSVSFGEHLQLQRSAQVSAYLKTILGWYAITTPVTVVNKNSPNPTHASGVLIVSLY